MAVNAFTQDAHEKSNPLIRALAVRTMSCIRIEKITQYLCESLKDCLIDEDPYVKKTAALSVAKVYQIMPEHTKEFGFIKLLQGLLQDGNAIVVANAAAALYEISKISGKNYIKTNKETIGKLLNALNETNEWGKIYILESIINYKPKAQKESEEIIERISPFLQHANPAVVLGSTKNIMHFIDDIEDNDGKAKVLKKLAAPLITLLSSEPEIQYVSLMNIQIILEQIPNIFEKNVKMFFCRFSDPIYVKLAKIDSMIKVADTINVDLIISELHTYCNDLDQDFVRRSVKAIGQVVCKVDRVAKKGIEALREYINNKNGSESALQEAVIAASKILRKYPKKHDDLIRDVCAQVERVDEPQSKAALIWIVGEFADKVPNAEEILQKFIDSFSDETTYVCLQMLTAAVKMYIKKSDECEEMVMKVLNLASEESDNPDLRDRGYIYWRMLSTDPTATKDVILIKRPEYTEDLTNLMGTEVRDLFEDPGITKKNVTLSSSDVAESTGDDDEVDDEDEDEKEPEVDEKPKKKPKKAKKDKKDKKKDKHEEETEQEQEVVPEQKASTDLEDIFGLGLSDDPAPTGSVAADPLADIFGPSTTSNDSNGTAASAAPAWDASDIFGGTTGAAAGSVSDAATFVKPKWAEVLSATTAGQGGSSGLKINGRFYREGSQIKLELEITNNSSVMASDFEIMFKNNSFGITPGKLSIVPVSAGSSFTTNVDCSINSANADQKTPPSCPLYIQTAIK